jgi:hypothetical protein
MVAILSALDPQVLAALATIETLIDKPNVLFCISHKIAL